MSKSNASTSTAVQRVEGPDRWRSLWLAASLGMFALIWFGSAGTRSLIGPDEGRYASLALEMMRTGDWVTPRLNGLLYFEKPALQYWIGAVFFHWFGINEFAARLWPALSGFLTVVTVGCTAARLWGRDTGVRAFAIAASTTWIIGNSHFLTLDAGLTFFLTLTLCSVLLSRFGSVSAYWQTVWMLVAWAAMAGGTLSKGLVGIVIPGASLVLVSVWRRNLGLWRGMRWASGLLVFLALAAPWFVAVSLRNPDFAPFFFVHEHFARYLTTVHHRTGAWWYYLPLLLVGSLPWTGALPWVIGRPSMDVHNANRAITPRQVLLAWCAFVLVFFSVSDSKLPSYILPVFPALALLVAQQLLDARATVLRWHLLVPTLLWSLALAASTLGGRLASSDMPSDAIASLIHAVRAGACLFLVAAALAWWQLGRDRITAAVLSVAIGHFVATTVLIQAHDRFGQMKSAASIAVVLRPFLDPGTPVFCIRAYDQTLPFYLRRNVTLVDYEDEFALGERLEPDKAIPTLDRFIERWKVLPKAAAYMTPVTWAALSQRGVAMRILFQDPRRIVVVKP